MPSCVPASWRATSGATPVKLGVNVGPGGLPPISAQSGAAVHWLLTRPIRESVTADRSRVITPPSALGDAVPAPEPSPKLSAVQASGKRGSRPLPLVRRRSGGLGD